jgi:beta-lactamase superfamily II metal-dependent hydrolase
VLVIAPGAVRVFVLPAHGGSAVYFNQERMLVDSGGEMFAQGVLKPFLQAQGVNNLRRFSLSSEHVEQIGGAQVIRTNFGVAHFDGVGELKAGANVEGWSVLHPIAGERHARADDNALALKGNVGAWTMLLLPRLGRAGQDGLLKEGATLRSDIVIAGLPAQDEPLSEPLLEAVAPRIIIIVDSESPATRRATSQLRDRLARRGARVFYCRDTGTLTLEARGKRLRVLDAGGATLGEFE